MIRLPVIDWQTEDVFEFLDGEQPPLYSMGFDRVGCSMSPLVVIIGKPKRLLLMILARANVLKVVQISTMVSTTRFLKHKVEAKGI